MVPEVADEAPPGVAGFGVAAPGEGVQRAAAGLVVVGRTHEAERLVLGQLLRRQVPQVLVHPVAGERACHPGAPPRLSGDELPPGPRGVPVVAQVVVVQQHAGGNSGQQPAHGR